MDEMKMYVWLLPVLFILHDMEEILFAKSWSQKRSERPAIIGIKPFGNIKDTEGFAIGVYEELIILTIVSLLSKMTGHYEIWYGMMAANVLHLIILHIIGTVCIYKAYMPGFITAILTLWPCIDVMIKTTRIMKYSIGHMIIAVLIGVVIAVINLKVLHKNLDRLSTLIQ